ncbi:hypothetical protein [Aquirufa aurantiipilula]
MSKSTMHNSMRVYHRYLGFFLTGIMAVYALSGTVLIFRETDFLKSEKQMEKSIPKDIKTEDLGKEMRMRDFKVEKEEGGIVYFKNGSFNRQTGIAQFKVKSLPFVMEKMVNMHKATTNSPLFFMNIFFGMSLLFFVISTFWMFLPKTAIFKKGLYFTLAGIILTLLMLFI